MNTTKVVVGILTSITAGAALRVLLAPTKGSETRKKISERDCHKKDEINDKLNKLMNSIAERLEIVNEEATNLFEKAKPYVAEIKIDLVNP